MWPRRTVPARKKSRGVAVLELTLSLVFLIPLMLGILDFGYYFYIGSNAEEAARQAVQQAVGLTTPCAGGIIGPWFCDPNVLTIVTNTANGSGTTCNGTIATIPARPPAAACYMNAPPLFMGGPSGNTSVTCACAPGPVNPTYTITVTVDFKAAVGYFRALMPAGTGNNVKYVATLTGN